MSCASASGLSEASYGGRATSPVTVPEPKQHIQELAAFRGTPLPIHIPRKFPSQSTDHTMYTPTANTGAHHTLKSSFLGTLSEISHSHQLSFPLLPPSPFTEDKINRIGVWKSLSRAWESTRLGRPVPAHRPASPRPSRDAGKGRESGPCLDPTCLELQQQQNAALSPTGERNRGHRLDTKDRNSVLKKKRFSLSQKERKPVTNALYCEVDNGKCKEYIHYVQDVTIHYSTKCALFQ